MKNMSRFLALLLATVFISPSQSHSQAGWLSQASGTTNWLLGVCFTNANTGTAVGDVGTILRTTTGGVTSVREDPRAAGKLPENFALEQNYPNPFNPTTEIRFHLPALSAQSGQAGISEVSHVALKVFDVLGRETQALVNEPMQSGTYSVQFDAKNLSSGIYFYRLQTETFAETKRMLLLK